MTKQLEDRIVHKEEKQIVMAPEFGGLLSSSQVVVFSTPPNVTPTISKDAKVMRLDYKLRVSVNIPNVSSGKDRELSVNLPIVVGTTGISTIYDSGFESQKPYGSSHHTGGSEGNNSMHNGFGGPVYPPPPISPTSLQFGYPPPPPGGFHMPEPHNFYPPTSYPPNRFVLNPQQLAYNSTPYPNEDNGKFETMPMPDFGGAGNDRPYSPFGQNEPLYPPPQNAMESDFDQIFALPEMTGEGSTTLSPTSSTHSRKNDTLAAPLRHPSLYKPNTPTPPQTPAIHNQAKDQKIHRPSESASSYYSSSLFMESTISDGVEVETVVTSSSNDRKSLPTRVDPLIPNNT